MNAQGQWHDLAVTLALECNPLQSCPELIELIAASAKEMTDGDDFVPNAVALYNTDADDGVDLADPAAQAIFEFGGDSTILENQDEFGAFKEAIKKNNRRNQNYSWNRNGKQSH